MKSAYLGYDLPMLILFVIQNSEKLYTYHKITLTMISFKLSKFIPAIFKPRNPIHPYHAIVSDFVKVFVV